MTIPLAPVNTLEAPKAPVRPLSRTSALRVAIIGCGAIARMFHLPALARHARHLRQVVLVDPDLSRARALADTLAKVPLAWRAVQSHEEVWDDIDAAIIATPPWLHAPIVMPLLARGIHVLCEKPLAESTAEATAMIDQAAQSGAWLCVNQTRRAFPALRRVKELVERGAIGECTAIEYAEGVRFNWQSASGWHFAPGEANRARGVLLDQGSHVLDTICWWLNAKPVVVSSASDSFGGPEGTVSVVLAHGACTIKVRLCWLTKLSNTYRITGTQGVIEGSASDWRRLTIACAGGRPRQLKVSHSRGDYLEFGNVVIDNFLDTIRGRATPLATAQAVLPSIQLMDECYRCASRMPMAWVERPLDFQIHVS